MEKTPDIDKFTRSGDTGFTPTTERPIPVPAVYIPPGASPVSDIDTPRNLDIANTDISLDDAPF